MMSSISEEDRDMIAKRILGGIPVDVNDAGKESDAE